jgi:hypothetical protein
MKVLVASQMRLCTPIDRHHKTITPPGNRPHLLHSTVKYRSEIFHYSPFLPFSYSPFFKKLISYICLILWPVKPRARKNYILFMKHKNKENS